MDFLGSLFEYHLSLVMLWFGCLALYLPLSGSKAGWRLGLPPLFLMGFGYLIYWVPLYQAGGGPSFYGTFSTDVEGMAVMMWVCLVLPATVLMAPPLAFVEWLRRRTLNERARTCNSPGSSLGLTRAPYL